MPGQKEVIPGPTPLLLASVTALVLVCIYIRQIMSAHVTTDIFHLGGTPASVGNYRITSRVYLYWPLLTLIMVNDVRTMINP